MSTFFSRGSFSQSRPRVPAPPESSAPLRSPPRRRLALPRPGAAPPVPSRPRVPPTDTQLEKRRRQTNRSPKLPRARTPNSASASSPPRRPFTASCQASSIRCRTPRRRQSPPPPATRRRAVLSGHLLGGEILEP
jgi:hypothetical protein